MTAARPPAPSRRDAVRLGLAAAGTAAFPGAAVAARPGRVETAVATICCDGFGDEDFAPAFDAIPKLGVPNVEFNCWYARNLTPDGLRRIKDRCDARNLKPVCIQASGFSGGAGHAEAREVSRLLWLIEACDRLGCRLVKCTGAARGTSGGTDSLVRILKAIVPAAEAAGVTFVLENHHGNVLEFPEDYDKIFAAVPSPRIGMCLDMGHFAASGVDLPKLIDRFHERILHIDVKDCAPGGKPKFVRFGTGVVDMAGTIRRCLDRGYKGYLVLELSLLDKATMLDDLRAGHALTKPFES